MNKEELKQKLEDTADKAKFKAKRAWEKTKEKTKEVGTWIYNHPGETLAIGAVTGTLLGEAGKIAKTVERRKRDREEEHRRLCEKYDPKTHSWVELRRPLTDRENVEFAERRQQGESAILILESFGVIKK